MKKQGQTFIEYTVLIGVVVTFMIAMSPMVRRGVQSMVKVVSDQVGNQINSEQRGGTSGHLIDSYTVTRMNQGRDTLQDMGDITYNYVTDRVDTVSEVASNLGYSKEGQKTVLNFTPIVPVP